MADSLYIYTSENTIDLFTPSLRQKLASKVSNEVINYYSNIRTDTPVAGNVDEISALIHFIVRATTYHGVGMNNILSKIGRNNVLFVTNFNDSEWPNFNLIHEEVLNPLSLKPNLGLLWSPLIDQYMEGRCFVNFTSTFPSGEQSVLKYTYGEFGVPSINCNKKYELGMTDWEIDQPDSKYDTVVLAGIANPSGQVHNIEDIKSTFAPYCTDDFILLDEFESDESRLEIAKLWPHNNPDEIKRIGLERPQRIEGNKLNFVEEYRSINTYSLFSEELDEASISFNRASDTLFEYLLDIY